MRAYSIYEVVVFMYAKGWKTYLGW